MPHKLDINFFNRDCLEVAPELLGKLIVRRFDDGNIKKFRITETEAYRGEEDLACHAAKGRTNRTEVMYHEAGKIYVYLIYGMYWLLNLVTSEENYPAAVLIRGIENINGPGRVGKALKLSKDLYDTSVLISDELWIEDDGIKIEHCCSKRIGIDYAGKEWANKPWRFKTNE